MIYQNTPFDWPLDFNIIRQNSEVNTFGMVRRRADGSPKPHGGWDFFASVGTPCFAVGTGQVVFSGEAGDFGQMIVIKILATEFYAAYAHLSKRLVKVGDIVSLGDQVAETGITGNAYNMIGKDQHLHFEIRTVAMPGLGLGGRESPLKIFGICPLRSGVKREAFRG